MPGKGSKRFGSAKAGHVAPRPYDSPSTDPEIRLRFHQTDDGRWPLHEITRKDLRILLKRVRYFESMTVSQAKQNGILADYNMAECPNKTAQDRLANQYDGQDSLARLTISGKKRLFGIRQGGTISVIWWDPEHELWEKGKVKR